LFFVIRNPCNLTYSPKGKVSFLSNKYEVCGKLKTSIHSGIAATHLSTRRSNLARCVPIRFALAIMVRPIGFAGSARQPAESATDMPSENFPFSSTRLFQGETNVSFQPYA
jgi:hypothetical protein